MTHALRGPGGRDVLVLGQNWSFCGPGVSVSFDWGSQTIMSIATFMSVVCCSHLNKDYSRSMLLK